MNFSARYRSLSIFVLAASTSLAVPTKTPPPAATAIAPVNDAAKALGNTFASIAEKVSPCVVVITVTRSNMPENAGPVGGDEHGDPFDFFHRGPRRSPVIPQDPGESQGSGFIVRADGFIYTNNHVVQGAEKIKVKLKDGRSLDGRVVGVDDKTDVAVIKVEGKDLPAVELGDSDVIRPGEWTIAIGAPFNLDYSVTVGVLSGKVRDRLGATVYEEYLQTQATINPGNSGGPLLDIDGRVIGINTLIKTRQGGGFNFYNANVGFAIPIKLAQKVGNLLITKGKVERPWIGVDIRTLSEATELKDLIKGIKEGVLVMAIRPETPAYQSGLKPGDVITQIDGVGVRSARDLQREILEKQIGQVVHLTIVRDGKSVPMDVKTGLQPTTQQVASHTPAPPAAGNQTYGMTVQPLTPELMEQYSVTDKQGLLIMDVEEESAAARSGLLPGMVITEVDGKKVSTAQALKDGLKKADPKKGSLLQVSKDGIRSFVVLRNGPAPSN